MVCSGCGRRRGAGCLWCGVGQEMRCRERGKGACEGDWVCRRAGVSVAGVDKFGDFWWSAAGFCLALLQWLCYTQAALLILSCGSSRSCAGAPPKFRRKQKPVYHGDDTTKHAQPATGSTASHWRSWGQDEHPPRRSGPGRPAHAPAVFHSPARSCLRRPARRRHPPARRCTPPAAPEDTRYVVCTHPPDPFQP